MKHRGKQTEIIEFDPIELDSPLEYVERGQTTWRADQITFTFARDKDGAGESWSEWRLYAYGNFRNVLKSGDLGQRALSSYDNPLTVHDFGGRTRSLAPLFADRLQPLVDELVKTRDAEAWNGCW